MADTNSGKKRSIGKILGLLAAAGLILCVMAYAVVTSSGFLKSVVLPKVSQALHAEVQAEQIDLSPFSRVVLRKLAVRTSGTEPLVLADEVIARYSLMDIIKGRIVVSEVSLVNPSISLVQEANGTSNLDPITKGQSTTSKTAQPASAPPSLDIRNISLRNAHFKLVQNGANGARKVSEITGLNLGVDRVQNGQPIKVSVDAALRVESVQASTNKAPNDLLNGKMDAALEVAIDSSLKPLAVKGSARLQIGQASGAYATGSGLNGTIDCDLTPTDLKNLAMRFERAGKTLAQLQISGPFDLGKMEGRLAVRLSGLDREVLNLAGASKQWDFGASTLSSTNLITLANQASRIGVRGQLTGGQLSLAQNGVTSPVLDLSANYDLDCNLGDQTATISILQMAVRRQGADLIQTILDKPMAVSWGGKASTLPDSMLSLIVTNLDLAQWKPLAGTNTPGGIVSASVKLAALNNGQSLKADLRAAINNLETQVGTNRLRELNVNLSASGDLANLKTLNLPQFQLKVDQRGLSLLEASGAIQYQMTNQAAKGSIILGVSPKPLLEIFPVAQLEFQQGTVRTEIKFEQSGLSRKALGSLELDGFQGKYGAYRFDQFKAAVGFDLSAAGSQAEIRKLSLAFMQNGAPAGTVDLDGSFNSDNGNASVQFRTAGLDQNLLRTFLSPSLGENELVSVKLNAAGSALYNPKGETSAKVELKLENWVVRDKATRTAGQPLNVQAAADVGMQDEVVDLRDVTLKLTPTTRANNQLQVKGRVDLKKTNATPSSINIASDGLDVTPYYNMFAGQTNQAPTPKQPGPTKAPAPGEPAPITLPFEQLTADLKIDKLFLREVAISNWVATIKINHGQVSFKPFQMVVNGGGLDLEGMADLSVPGYRYDLTLRSDRIPLAPFANSFSTNNQGRMQGQLVANASIKGQGITGASLQKNLAGNVGVSLTNLNVQIVGGKTRMLLEPVAIVLRVSELLDSPLTLIDLKTQIGAGNINLNRMFVGSPAFQADVTGVIPINQVLTNSPLDLPTSFALRRSLAQKAGLLGTEVPTNAAYAALPSFLKLGGTLGAPKSEINKLVISGLLLRSVGGLAPALGDKAANLLQGAGGLLSGQKSAPTGTNAPASGTNAINTTDAVARGLSGLLNRSVSTNPPAATNSAPQTNAAPSALDLLKLFDRKKK